MYFEHSLHEFGWLAISCTDSYDTCLHELQRMSKSFNKWIRIWKNKQKQNKNHPLLKFYTQLYTRRENLVTYRFAWWWLALGDTSYRLQHCWNKNRIQIDLRSRREWLRYFNIGGLHRGVHQLYWNYTIKVNMTTISTAWI